MRTVFLTKRWQHHTPSGGYDLLAAAYAGAGTVRRAAVGSRTARLARNVWQKFTRSGERVMDYQFGDYLAESRVLWKSARGNADVVHVLYGDEQLDLLLRRRRWLRAKLVVTFHLPTAGVAKRWEQQRRHLADGIDAAVVVSRSQLGDYRRWLGDERVVFIPHGIDTERFAPAGNLPEGERLRLLMVGEHLRDWETIHRAADFCAAQKLPVDFDAVIYPPFARYFTGCDNVRVHSAVPEETLIDLYQRADALFLPVTGATANNAVLESLACGTPVITSAVGGMLDYVDAASGWLFPAGEHAPFRELIATLCRDQTLAHAKRHAARAMALGFRWEAVAAQVRAVHAAVLAGRPAAGAVDG